MKIINRFLSKIYKLSDQYKTNYRSKKLPYFLEMVIIGILLSDGSLEKSSNNSLPRLSISFSLKNSPYLLHLYNLLEPYTNSFPDVVQVFNNKTKTYNTVIKFKTVSLPVWLKYHNMFYSYNKETKRYKKILPQNINNIITPVVLAHLIMGDGNFKLNTKQIRIYTNSFSKKEVELLSIAINKNINIKTDVVHDRKDQFILIIRNTEIDKTKLLIKNYMHESMLYKIDINTTSPVNKYNYKKLLDNYLI